MFSIAARTVLAGGATAAAMSAMAQDPFVYRECMAQCKQYRDRSCCHETCSYNACIADKIKASIGRGTRKEGVRLDQIDPGAWSAAMAACYSWISILQQCSAGTPGSPPLGARAPQPASPAPKPTGKVILRLSAGPPKPESTDANRTTVRAGAIVNQGAGYKGTYSWDAPPGEITEQGVTLNLKVVAECKDGQRMATGLTIDGPFDLIGPDNPTAAKSRIDFPVNCESKPGSTMGPSSGGAVKILPRKAGYAAGSQVRLRLGAFWGKGVDYIYEPVK